MSDSRALIVKGSLPESNTDSSGCGGLIRRHLVVRLLLLALLAAHAYAIPAQAVEEDERAEKRKIEALIASVEALRDAVFIRNGKAYEPATAAKFLRGKWNQQARDVRSARQFIEKVATRSSTTGRIYLVRYSDGREVPVATYLHSELRKLQ